MTLEEKISHLQSAAMEEARAQGNAIIKQHEEALQSVFEQHRAEAVRQSETRLKAEATNARQQLNMAASKAQLELKRELSRTQGELKNKLFDEVLRLIDGYMKTDDYKRLLIAYIESAARYANGETMTLYLNPSDEDKMAYLQEHTGMTLTVTSAAYGLSFRDATS